MNLWISTLALGLFWTTEVFGCWISYTDGKHVIYQNQTRLTLANQSFQETAREFKLLIDAQECGGMAEPLTVFKNGSYFLTDDNGIPITSASPNLGDHIAKFNVLKNANILGYFNYRSCNIEQLSESTFQISHYTHRSKESVKTVVSGILGSIDDAMARLVSLNGFSQCKVKNQIRCDIRAGETSYFITQDIPVWVKDPFSDEYSNITQKQTVGSGFRSLTETINAIAKLETAGACDQSPDTDPENEVLE